MLIFELQPKKMSGRWGDRPLGRGGWRVLQPEVSSQLRRVPLRSRAVERHRSNQGQPSYSGSRNQLPITVDILRSALSSVDSPTGSFFSVLPGTLSVLYLVPTYLRRPFAAFFHAYNTARDEETIKEQGLQKNQGAMEAWAALPIRVLGRSPLLERLPTNPCSENAEADASPKN
jgi:hypothetical protein